MGKFIDLKGQRFGRLTVIEIAGYDEKRSFLWLCHCDCGNKTIVRSGSLRSGDTKSCGCLQKEAASKATKSNFVGKKFNMLTVILVM